MSQWINYPSGTMAGIIVDNFLLIGGILSCNSILKDLNRGRFNLFRFYFHRFLRWFLLLHSAINMIFFYQYKQKQHIFFFTKIFRLTPLYSMIIFFTAALAGRLGSGPNWNTVQHQSEDCRTYWWSHLLYINNIFPSDLTFVKHFFSLTR